MKIRRINESAEFNFNSAASSGNWPYKMSIETYVDIRDEISQIIDNLDQSCVFAIARDATKLGLNIDKERLYYSPIVTIENNISPEKINQFRSIVMKYSNGQLNESSSKKFYIDEIVSAQGGKTKTERHFFATLDELKKYCKDSGLTKDDIANCGGCNIKDLCESYAHVKIPRAIKEFVDNLCDEINADQGDGEHDEEDEDPWSTEYGYNENLWDRGTGGDYYMDGKPSSYYADEVMEAVIEKFGDVLKTDEQRLAVYCYVEFMDEPEWVDTLSEGAEKLHTKRLLKRLGINEKFDTAEHRIQRYEYDIPELMTGMHDDYMEGKLDADRYAEVLRKVYDALSECDYKYTMSAPVVTNGSGKRVLDALDKLDKTNESVENGIEGDKVVSAEEFSNNTNKKYPVSVCSTDAHEDDYDDDYSNDYDESLEECSGIKAHKVIMGEA